LPKNGGIFSLVQNKSMFEGRHKIQNQAATHFLTFTVVEWVDVFTRKIYKDILLDSIRHCQYHRGLFLHCWCLMSNHLHLIASAKNQDLSAIVRDFKKFTSKKLVAAIETNPNERRKEWMLPVFQKQGERNSRNKENQFWIQDNHPEELYTEAFTFQKLNYIHNNPVKAGFVCNPWDYLYSSAKDYEEGKKCGLLEIDFL